MSIYPEKIDGPLNPLDSVEEVLHDHNWSFNRMSNHELVLNVRGKSCQYEIFFIWQEDMSALQFCCQYDVTVSESNKAMAAQTILEINEELWMGHFDLPGATQIPSFRHTCLLRGVNDIAGAEHIEDLVDLSLAQCEQYFPVFHLLSLEQEIDPKTVEFALMNGAGRA